MALGPRTGSFVTSTALQVNGQLISQRKCPSAFIGVNYSRCSGPEFTRVSPKSQRDIVASEWDWGSRLLRPVTFANEVFRVPLLVQRGVVTLEPRNRTTALGPCSREDGDTCVAAPGKVLATTVQEQPRPRRCSDVVLGAAAVGPSMWWWDFRGSLSSVPAACVVCLVLASAVSVLLAWSTILGVLFTAASVFGLAIATRPNGPTVSPSSSPSASSTPAAAPPTVMKPTVAADVVIDDDEDDYDDFADKPSPVAEPAKSRGSGPGSRSATVGALGLSRQHIIYLRRLYQRHHGPGVR
ncbi:hypothetical protein HPB50_015375 [Hyalomma asiaticum]|uniref:Uncharacterized protein n=1 Tax=Hyalomma asiaticum TaxID=266040 RepID=A0ACB7T781_HYAAI|nr:hypothetical protein HPB50_015375 [Hyalomma asiaticum]